MAAPASSSCDFQVQAAILRAMARDFGSIARDGNRWVLTFWIEGERYRVRNARLIGTETWVPLTTRELAETVLDAIRQDFRETGKPLAAVSPYLRSRSPARTVRAKWAEFIEAKTRQGRHAGRQLSRERLAEFTGYKRRGHLEPLLEFAVERVSYAVLEGWRDWLFGRGLSSGYVHHLVTDVGTFLRWLERRQEIGRAPELPTVHVRRETPRIPDPGTQARLFEAIPWRLRGVFLARGQHGLRPSEARRARVSDWRREVEPISLGDGSEVDCHALTVRGKGHRNRVLPVPAASDLARWVAEFVVGERAFGSAPLFANPQADPDGDGSWSSSATRRVWLAACREVGVHFEENQAMRHAYATAQVNRGGRSGLCRRRPGPRGHPDDPALRRARDRGARGDPEAYRPVGAQSTRGGLVTCWKCCRNWRAAPGLELDATLANPGT